jgi:CRISPR-associated endonuclease/helicase Cas3
MIGKLTNSASTSPAAMPATPPAIFAHSLPDFPPTHWELLDDHAADVARRAAECAASFEAQAWGGCLGRWHDIGKRLPDFQRYIRGLLSAGPPHAWAGAMWAAKQGKAGVPVAFAIAGHHCGLADLRSDPTAIQGSGGPTPLTDLLRDAELVRTLSLVRASFSPHEASVSVPQLPPHVLTSGSELDLFIRFLFSALVDADRLATAAFYARFHPAITAADLCYDGIGVLQQRLDRAIDAMPPKGSPAIVELRRQVLDACRVRASDAPGRFSLTVPTGGGKTLSAMSFALNHAKANRLRRVIVVIPYTSIIEQSARVYRDVLGDPNVLEHHSNLDEQKLTELDARGERLRKLAAENWDAPVVVTTTVQFFQSLLSNHPGRCRKLHNIAQSVVLLDEVQTLPPQFLRTIIDVLGQLTDHYRCSVVLSTATPPSLVPPPSSRRAGLRAVDEIMPDPSALARSARRVRIEWRIDAPTPYDQIAAELRAARQALAIVHRRDDARRLAEQIGGDVLHLSALMCPAHRTEVVAEVRRRLQSGEQCLLVSTQLVEAGVDIDFPLVYRALAGLDSIAQSAGRCDREGKLTDAAGGNPAGRLIVFRAETDPPPGVPRKALDTMHVLFRLGAIDPFEPNDSLKYFDELYGKIDDDQHRIEMLRRDLMFATVADKFRIIDADTHPVVVPWGDARQRLAAFRAAPSRQTQRALQPFTVQVRRYRLDALRSAGVVMPIDEFERFDVVAEGREGSYDVRFGLNESAPGVMAADDSVI